MGQGAVHRPHGLTDAAEARDEIDATRTAAMGGSFGGYMANWIAGHTDRFTAIVTHASLWALDQFGPTTDDASYWLGEMTEEMAMANSPHLAPTRSRRRCSSSTATRTTASRSARPCACGGTSSRARSDPATRRTGSSTSPTRTTGSSSPQHAIVWYETVLAFLAQHVLGEDAEMPEILR